MSDWHARILANGQVVAVVSSVNSSVSTHYLIQDALGSTVAVTDETGTTTTRIAYDAWGNLVSPSDGTTKVDPTTISIFTTVGYTGGELIAEANLVQMGARLYDPASGVFLNPDPTVAAPFDARDWNQYAYVYDNPMSYTDPTGYEPCIQTGDKSWDCGSIGTATVFSPWSQGVMDCTEFAEQSNPACHDAIYGVPPNYGNDDVFLALAARADAMAKAAEKKTKDNQNQTKICLVNAHGVYNNLPTTHPDRPGAYGVPETLGTAAIDRAQWIPIGVDWNPVQQNTYLNHYRNQISGYIPDGHGSYIQVFNGVSDNMGPSFDVVRLENIYPGRILFELPGGQNLGDVDNMKILIPSEMTCPSAE